VNPTLVTTTSTELFVQCRDEAPPEELKNPIFNIAEWPVFSKDARVALANIVDTHYIRAPPIYDLLGNIIKPHMYHRRTRGATIILHFTYTFYKWAKKNTFCADLTHMRILINNPSPQTPITPCRQKRKVVYVHDPEYVLKQPDFKKALTRKDGVPPPFIFYVFR